MTLTSPSTTPVGPPPPFDAELDAALAVFAEFMPPSITPDLIPLMRQPNPAMMPPSDEQLARDGKFSIEERGVAGPGGRARRAAADLPSAPASPRRCLRCTTSTAAA